MLLGLLLAGQAAAGTVVVLPPEGGAAQAAWVGEAVADLLPRDLALLGVPAVDRADLLRAQEALAIPPVSLSRATAIRVAEALGASRLVLGTHESDGATLTLALRLLDVERGTLSTPLRASGPRESLAELVHGLAWDVALTGSARPTRTREQYLSLQRAVPFEALSDYAQALAAPDHPARIKLLRRALVAAPRFDEARLALGRAQLQAGERAAAEETFSRVTAPSPLARTARFLQGVALLELGRYREAGGVYGLLAAEDPTAAVLNNHALALLRIAGPGIKASDELRKAVEMAPGVVDLPFNLGWALLVEGDAEAAAFWLRGVTRQQTADAHARVALCWALKQSGHVDEAEDEWKGLTAVAPAFESVAAPDLARRFERTLPTERPMVLDRDGRREAELAAVHIGRSEKLRDAGDLDGALRELTQAAYLDPYGPRGHHLLARTHVARGDKEKALNELRVSLWCREDETVRLELAALLKGMGRAGEARAEAEKVLKASPASRAARALLQDKQ